MNNFNSNEKGSVTILFALSLTVMIAFLAIVSDLGYLALKRAYAQNYADQYALFCQQQYISGVAVCPRPPDSFYDISFTPIVTGPSDDLCVKNGQTDCIRVEVSTTWTPFFAGQFGISNTLSVGASAMAASYKNSFCVLALNSGVRVPNPPRGGIYFSNGGSLTTNNCNIGVKNGASPITPLYLLGETTLSANGARVQIEGALASNTISGSSVITPAVVQTASINNPLSFLGELNWMPNLPGCRAQPSSAALTSLSGATIPPGRYCARIIATGAGTITLNPGYYANGIAIENRYTNVIFNPGIYYLNTNDGSNSLHINSAAGTIRAAGVTFINLGGTFKITNSGGMYPIVEFSAPTENIANSFTPGTLLKVKGMSYIQIQDAKASIQLNPARSASIRSSIAGNIYAPNAEFNIITFNSNPFNIGAIVANYISFQPHNVGVIPRVVIAPQTTDAGGFGSVSFVLAQ